MKEYGLVVIALIVLLALLIYILMKKLKKVNKVPIKDGKPNLMMKDPSSSGQVNLMDPDPVLSIKKRKRKSSFSKIKEVPSLEEQLKHSEKKSYIKKNIFGEWSNKESLTANNQGNNEIAASPVLSAFDMSIPTLKEDPIEIMDFEIENSGEVGKVLNNKVIANSGFHKTQKFCPQCGSPNDVINKFCISCGYNFESRK